MAAQQVSQDLSPQLCAVLSSLSVSLESELNRYRRNHHYQALAEADLFAEIEDPSFDLQTIESEVEASIAQAVAAAKPASPPPVPPNKKLLSQAIASGKDAKGASEMDGVASTTETSALAIAPTNSYTSLATTSATYTQAEQTPTPLAIQSSQTAVDSSALTSQDDAANEMATGAIAQTGYLSSSEKLIESLTKIAPPPDPLETIGEPKRKTVSLLAGAMLGFFGLTAGLSASYLMANPNVAQRLASKFQAQPVAENADPVRTFDPPGPDLSASEFINLEIDNLSSLEMPQTALSPAELPATLTAPPAATPSSEVELSSSASIPASNSTASGLPAIPTAPVAPTVTGTQAVVVPVGLTYYVTAPATTAQALNSIRETVSEAFIRRFADGDRIQIAAFDNPQAAQEMVAELEGQSITAQIYGPTTE